MSVPALTGIITQNTVVLYMQGCINNDDIIITLLGYMVSMTSVKDVIALGYGKHSRTVSIVYLQVCICIVLCTANVCI